MTPEQIIVRALVTRLHRELIDAFRSPDSPSGSARWGSLCEVIAALEEVSDQESCMHLHAIFDDMLYAIRETNMGAACKAESALPELEEKVAAYLDHRDQGG